MANTELKSTLSLDIKINLELSLSEAKALVEIIAYGDKAFLEVYYKHLGKTMLQKEEAGVISLFKSLKTKLPNRIKEAQEVINKVKELQKP